MLADQLAGRDDEVAVLHRDTRYVEHAPADETHLAAVARGGVHRLLQARNIRSEHRDDDAAFGARENICECLADHAFGECVPGDLGVGRVGAEQQRALVAVARERGDVGGLAVDRRLVEFEVAGMDHVAERRAQRDDA